MRRGCRKRRTARRWPTTMDTQAALSMADHCRTMWSLMARSLHAARRLRRSSLRRDGGAHHMSSNRNINNISTHHWYRTNRPCCTAFTRSRVQPKAAGARSRLSHSTQYGSLPRWKRSRINLPFHHISTQRRPRRRGSQGSRLI